MVAVGLLVACGSATSGGGATKAWVAETEVEKVEVVKNDSGAAGFTLVLEKEMPTPGWTFVVDSVETDAAASRLTAKLTEVGPDGIVAQVLTSARIEIPLGSIEPGAYFVEIWTRRNTQGKHQPGLALIVVAR
jgi:hypothetical protein